MKIIKLGSINFYIHPEHGDIGKLRLIWLIKTGYINRYDVKFEFCDCLKEECDVVFYSLWGKLDNLKNVKGNPKFVYWTDENLCQGAEVDKLIYSGDFFYKNPFDYYKNNNYSISFYADYNDNLFFPMWLIFDYHDFLRYKRYDIKFEEKNKFASFIASNNSYYQSFFRNTFVEVLSKEYKQVDCMGSCLHNTDFYLSYDVSEAVKTHEPYKFNICFENSLSSGKLFYITEKILNAYKYNTIPIYWGSCNSHIFFNKDTFIDATNKPIYEVIDQIKRVDNDKELYEYMINQNPISSVYGNIDDLFDNFVYRLVHFIKKILDS